MVSAVACQVNGKEGTSALKFMAVTFASVRCGACDTLLSAFKDQQSEKKRGATEAGAAGSKKRKGASCPLEMRFFLAALRQFIGDSLANDDGGDDEEEEEENNKDGSASDEERNADGVNDDA